MTGHKPINLVTDPKIYDLLLDYEQNVYFNILYFSKDIQNLSVPEILFTYYLNQVFC